VLWDFAEQERVNVFGTSAKYQRCLQNSVETIGAIPFRCITAPVFITIKPQHHPVVADCVSECHLLKFYGGCTFAERAYKPKCIIVLV